MNEITTTATRERSRGRLSRRLRQLAIGAAGAACALMLGASAASADSWWSPAYPPRVSVGNFGGDCTIRSGPVYDSNPPAQGWGVIGGGQLACATPHTYQMWVQEYFSKTNAPGSYYRVATTGGYRPASDYGGYAATSRICGSGYWFTRVIVSASGYTPPLYLDSIPHPVATAC